MFLCCTIGFCAALLIARFPATRASTIAVNVGNTSAHTRLLRPARKPAVADKPIAINRLTKASVFSAETVVFRSVACKKPAKIQITQSTYEMSNQKYKSGSRFADVVTGNRRAGTR